MKEGSRGARVRKGDVTMEAKATVMQLLVWGHKPRNAGTKTCEGWHKAKIRPISSMNVDNNILKQC